MVPGRAGRLRLKTRREDDRHTCHRAGFLPKGRTLELWLSLNSREGLAMSLPRRGGKRRRSTSDSDSFLGSSADRSDSRLLPSEPVLSPPAGLGRSWKDSGRRVAAAAGTPRPLGQGRGGQVSCALCREVSGPRGARLSSKFLRNDVLGF